jgi:ribosomal protein S11
MNSLFGISETIDPGEHLLETTIITPIYVIHVKCSSNNTIISVHAPSTPKPRITQVKTKASSRLQINASSSEGVQTGEAFSVQSNPDAAPELSGEERAIKESKSAAAAAKLLIAPSAERCIGWASGGSCHYKKVNRSTYEAGYAASVSFHHFWFGAYSHDVPVQVRIIRRIEEAFQHVASGRRIEDLAPMKELKPGTIIAPERSSHFLRKA